MPPEPGLSLRSPSVPAASQSTQCCKEESCALLVYTAPRQVTLKELPRPRPAAGECEIAVAAAGICGSDLSGFLGRSRHRTPPLVMGHELVGRRLDGRRVVVNPLIGCGHCAACLSGEQNLCSDFRLLGMDRTSGCHAEFVAVPESHVYEIPDHLTDSRAVLTEPLANIVHLFRIAAPPPGFRMGIVGGGTMGSMALLMARRMGAREILVEDVNEARLETVRQMGATLAVNAGAEEGRRFAGRGWTWCSMPAAQAKRGRRLSISAALAAWWFCWAWGSRAARSTLRPASARSIAW